MGDNKNPLQLDVVDQYKPWIGDQTIANEADEFGLI